MLTKTQTIANFQQYATVYQGAALQLISAGTVAFIVGAHGRKPQTPAEIAETLQDAITDRGLKQAQVYRYIALSRALAASLEKDFPDGDGPIEEVLGAEDARAASVVIHTGLVKQRVHSVDKLSEVLGTYRRTPKAAVSAEGATPARAPRGIRQTVAAVAAVPEKRLGEAIVKAGKDVEAVCAEIARDIDDLLVIRAVLAIFETRRHELEDGHEHGHAGRRRQTAENRVAA